MGTPTPPPPDGASLTPAQRRVVVDLMARGQPRPRHDPDLGERLRAELEGTLGPIAGKTGEDTMWVTKHALGQVHGCEAQWQAGHDGRFAWDQRRARGTVVHRAVQLSVAVRHEPVPLDLVDHAMDSLCHDDRRTSPGAWLRDASPLELADLRADANDLVAKFLECWPPLEPAWRPCCETAIGAPLCGERILLWGKVDLVLGRARGHEARALLVDLKTGRPFASDLDDLRFYALVQTLRVGVPPFRVASYYLDTATFHHEDVSVDTLALAVRRTAEGVTKLLELGAGRSPTISPGPRCGRCQLAESCEGGIRWHADADDDAYR